MAYIYFLKKQRNKGNVTTYPQPHPIPELLHTHLSSCILFGSSLIYMIVFCHETYLLVIVIDVQYFVVLHWTYQSCYSVGDIDPQLNTWLEVTLFA